jgi:tRNA threonylcarbamoyladenosine biosynthesis protein TsaE
MMQWKTDSLEELDSIAAQILKRANDNRIFAVKGEMGAGKTTLIKSLCSALGVIDVIASPTYTLMNEYATAKSEPVYHFDFYRIKNIDEVYDIGYEVFFFSGNYCFIEWPEKIESLLNFRKATIFITFENNHRLITLNMDA